MIKEIKMRTRLLLGMPIEVSVESEALSKVAYDKSKLALEVTFKSGSTYQYGCVEPQTFKDLIHAKSKGRFFQKQIRNSHPTRRMVEA